jgi:hypothetical protein
MSERKHVVVTGAAGRMVGLILPVLRERYDLTLLDRRRTTREGIEIADIQIVDLLDRNRDAYRRYFQDAYAVVHGGWVGSDDPAQVFWAELSNVEMAYNVYQAAWEANARRVVVMSSNHAADYYEPLILDHKMDVVSPEMRALSDNYYGWAKEAYEHLGFVFAAGQVNGRPLENVQIRIGAPRETDGDHCALGDLHCVRRALGAYMSQRDMQQLFIKSIEAEDIRDERGVPFQIFYGISGNHHAFWSIANAREVIGYAPEDNSEIRFHELIARHVQAVRQKGK